MHIQPKIVLTDDGSNTLVHPSNGAHYHSTFGAKQESDFIFIKEGLEFYTKHLDIKSVSILEMGFGSGLNTFNSLLYSLKNNIEVTYIGVEKFPILKETASKLDYPKIFNAEEFSSLFNLIHTSNWETKAEITPNFNLLKKEVAFEDLTIDSEIDIIYFDAFGPKDQPELWTKAIFQKLYNALKPNGILVTYCSKGIVKQALRSVGFTVKRLSGPPSKRHVLRVTKS